MAIQKITADVIANSAVTTDSLSDSSITAAKLHTTLDLTGKTVTVATASAGDNDTTVASTAFVSTAIANLADSAPSTLDTLNELAAALGDDANFSTTVTNSIALKAPLAGPDFTGDVTFDTSTLVVDATNNRVGIGTTSPSYPLEVQSGGVGTVLRAGTSFVSIDPTGSESAPSLIFNGDANTGIWRPAADTLAVSSAGSEAMRIDSSGNLLVGNTSTILDAEENEEQGVDIRPFGFVKISRSGNHPLQLARTEDGELIKLRTNENTIGSIGTKSGGLYIGTDDAGIFFNHHGSGNLDAVLPYDIGQSSFYNGHVDLGATGGKFKNLYLSGGVYANNASGAFLWNSENAHIAFGTNNTERMRIDSSGNVGIGSDSISGISANATTLDIRGGVTTKGGAIRLRSSDSSVSTYLYADNTNGLSINTSTSHPMVFRTAGGERMRINAAGGLSLNDNLENPLNLNRTTTTTGASYMKFTNAGGNYYIGADSSLGDRMAIGGLAYGFTMTAESGRPLVFATSNTARMTIDSSGNVGIGTTSPVEKLHVEGSMMLDAYNVGAEEGLFLRQGFSSSNKYNLGIMTYAHNGSTNDGLTIGAYNGFSVCTGSNSRQERMRINSSGNVGIGTDSISNLLQVAGAIGLNHAAMRSGATTGDFSVTVSGLTTLSGSAWKQMGFLVFYAGVDGTLAGSNMFLSMIRLRGLSTYASAVQSNIVGTATISDSSASSTGLTINFDVGNSNQGSVYVLLLGGHGNRPSITISG